MHTGDIAKEKQELLRRLRESEGNLAGAATIPQELANICPETGSWSVLQIVEHITLADRAMLQRFKDSGPNAEAVKPDMDQIVESLGRDRENRRQAPPHVQPAGRFAALAEGLNEYRRGRTEIIAFVENNDEDFRKKLVKHPIGEMDGYQLFLLIAAHSERHALQIEAVKRSEAYRAATQHKPGTIAS